MMRIVDLYCFDAVSKRVILPINAPINVGCAFHHARLRRSDSSGYRFTTPDLTPSKLYPIFVSKCDKSEFKDFLAGSVSPGRCPYPFDES